MSIQISNLTKTYGSQKAIDNITFNAGNHEIVGFLGPNGAGKSTTLKIVTGYMRADSGAVMINGIDVNRQPLEIKKKIGYLPESNPLYYEMYVREYLGFIAELHEIRKNVKNRIEEVIEITRLRIFFFSSRRRHTRLQGDWSSDVCSSDLMIRHTRLQGDWSSDVCSSD